MRTSDVAPKKVLRGQCVRLESGRFSLLFDIEQAAPRLTSHQVHPPCNSFGSLHDEAYISEARCQPRSSATKMLVSKLDALASY